MGRSDGAKKVSRRSRLAIGGVLLWALFLPISASAAECNYTWTGAVDSEWQVAGNWAPEGVPGPSDVACIPAEQTAEVASGTYSIEVLQGEGRLTITAGSLALTGPEPSHIQKLHLSGGALRGPAELLVTESLHADGGAMAGSGNTVIGAGASGHVDALEEGEGPGLRLTEERELHVKGVLEVAGLGGQLNAIEGSFIGVSNAGELAVKGPEASLALSESSDLVNAATLNVGGPEGRLLLNDNATLLNSQALVLESPSGGLISRDDSSIENNGDLTLKSAAGEIRAEGTKIHNAGTLAIEAAEGRIRGSGGAQLENSGTLIVNGEGEANGLVAGTGEIPKLKNTGTVRKDQGTEISFVGFEVDSESSVEVGSGKLAFTAGGNSGQGQVSSWVSGGEETQIVFARDAFTFGEAVEMKGSISALEGAALKSHCFKAGEADIWLGESSLEITGTEDESRLRRIEISGGKAELAKSGAVQVQEVDMKSGTFDAADQATITIMSFYQQDGETKIGSESTVSLEGSAFENGSLAIGPKSDVDLGGLFYQGPVSTSIGTGSTVTAVAPVLGQGTFEIGANGLSDLGSLYVQEAQVQIGANSTVEALNPSFEGGTFEVGEDSAASFGNAFQQNSEITLDPGASYEAEITHIQSGAFSAEESTSLDVEHFYLKEGDFTISNGAVANFQDGYFEAGTLDGAGSVVAVELGWEATSMSGSGTTTVTEIGALKAKESLASLDQRTLVTKGFFTLGNATLSMANGARLENEGEFDASSEQTAFGPQIQVSETSAASPKIINKDEFNKESGTGTTEVTVPFENQGHVGQFSGTLHIASRLGVPTSQRFGFRCHCGDPIETASGDLVETQTDFAIGGRGIGLALTRSYSAQAATEATGPGVFGYGWSNSFGDRLEFGKGILSVVRADGSTVPFVIDGEGGFDAPPWSQDTLTGDSEVGYTYIEAGRIRRHFAPSGALQRVTDRNGNETALLYTEAGKLKAIVDPAGRDIDLSYNAEGLVESAEDPMGHLVEYGYEGQDLASVTLPGEAEPRWRFEYDPMHRMTAIIDGRGGETTNEYDEANRIIAQTDPVGTTLAFEYDGFHTRLTNEATEAVTDMWFNSNNEPTTITKAYGTSDATTETFAYDSAGHQLSKTDGNGHTTTYSYNAAGDRIRAIDAEGGERTWTYNETHDVISMTTPGGETTTIERDANGNVESISRPGPEETTQTTSYEYDGHGQLASFMDPLERIWSYDYNSQGDLISEADPVGNTQTFEYDENSRLVSTVTPRGSAEGVEPAEYQITIERDPQGRPQKVIDPLGHAIEYAYDANGNLEEKTNANGHTTKYVFNADNEQIKVEKPNGAILETGYDGAGNVTSQTDGNEKTTTYVRNALGQPVEVIDPLSRKTIEEFNDAGNLKAVIDPAERKTSYAYDKADRLIGIDYSSEATPDASFEYDPDGNVTKMVDGTGESSFGYDQLGRLTEAEDGHGDFVGYGYNLGDELTGILYPNGKAISRTFDKAGRLESVTDWLGGSTTFSYDPDSNVEAIAFPLASGNLDEYSFDQADRMSAAKFKSGPETLASLSYTRDKIGQIEEEARSGLPGSAEVAYEYDENERLTKAGEASFEYDPADNLTKAPGTTNAYDAASQLETGTGISYTYDKLGERTKATPEAGPATSYGYDQAGNLISIERPEEGEVPAIEENLAYDATGLLASKTSGLASHYFTWDNSGPLPLLLNDGENSYIYGPNDQPIEQISAEEKPTYLHHDQLGSTRLLTNASGEASATFSYSPYGTLEGSTGTATTPLGFAGQYTDAESGLQYLRDRFYDPATAQLLTRDPMSELTRTPYSYARSNPLRFVDPSGRACVEQFNIGGFSMGAYPNLLDCLGEGAKEVVASPVGPPAIAVVCLFAEPCGAIEGAILTSLVATAGNLVRSKNEECFDLESAEINSLIASIAAAIPGIGLEAGTARAGNSVGLSPLRERILHIATDIPGLLLEVAHAAAGH